MPNGAVSRLSTLSGRTPHRSPLPGTPGCPTMSARPGTSDRRVPRRRPTMLGQHRLVLGPRRFGENVLDIEGDRPRTLEAGPVRETGPARSPRHSRRPPAAGWVAPVRITASANRAPVTKRTSSPRSTNCRATASNGATWPCTGTLAMMIDAIRHPKGFWLQCAIFVTMPPKLNEGKGSSQTRRYRSIYAVSRPSRPGCASSPLRRNSSRARVMPGRLWRKSLRPLVFRPRPSSCTGQRPH